MRRLGLFVCLLIGVCLVTSCAAPGSAPAAPAAGDVVATRTVTDAKGSEVAIPVDPQRIVVIDYNAVEELLALGIKPAGILYDAPAHLSAQLAGVPVVGKEGAPNLEVILQLKPDLIVAVGWWIDDTVYQRLGEIAPTVMIDRQNFHEWKQYLRAMGELVGRSERAEQLLAEYDARVAEVRAAIGEDRIAQTEVSAFRPYGDASAYLIWLNSFCDSILADVGFPRPQAQIEALPEGAERIDNVSLEMLPLLDADVIFTVAPWTDDTTAFFNGLQTNPLWQQLRAVQANQVFTVSGPWNEGSIIAANLVLDDLLTTLAPDAAATQSAGTTTAECRTITHDMGETEVCGTPAKVIVLGSHMLDIALALGIQPLGYAPVQQFAGDAEGTPVQNIAYLGPYVKTMPVNVGTREEPNLEVILSLKPELILSELRDESQLALLQQIAPVLAYRGSRADEWQRTIVPIAAALNIPHEAQRVIDEHNAYIAEKHAELAPIIAAYPRISFIAQNQDGELSAFDTDTWAGGLLTDLGFELVSYEDSEDGSISVEQMPEIATDTIIVGASGEATPELAKELWTGNAVLMAHPASVAGRVFFADYQLWSRLRGPLAARLVTAELIRFLTTE